MNGVRAEFDASAWKNKKEGGMCFYFCFLILFMSLYRYQANKTNATIQFGFYAKVSLNNEVVFDWFSNFTIASLYSQIYVTSCLIYFRILGSYFNSVLRIIKVPLKRIQESGWNFNKVVFLKYYSKMSSWFIQILKIYK